MAENNRADRFTLSSAAGLRVVKAARRLAVQPAVVEDKIAAAGGSTRRSYALFQAKQAAEKKWHLIDADGLAVGRLAVIIANILRGKHKPSFNPHVDSGDHVIVINADKVRLTGNKLKRKTYHKNAGYAGGVSALTADKAKEGRFPARALEKAVERMIPRGPLGRQQMRALHLYAGNEHPHGGSQPQPLDLISRTRNNKVGS